MVVSFFKSFTVLKFILVWWSILYTCGLSVVSLSIFVPSLVDREVLIVTIKRDFAFVETLVHSA